MFWVMNSPFMLHSIRSFGRMATLTGKSSERNSRPSNGKLLKIVNDWQPLTVLEAQADVSEYLLVKILPCWMDRWIYENRAFSERAKITKSSPMPSVCAEAAHGWGTSVETQLFILLVQTDIWASSYTFAFCSCLIATVASSCWEIMTKYIKARWNTNVCSLLYL